MNDVNENIQAIIDARKPEMFTNPEQQPDAEALGILVSQWAGWDGNKIIMAFLAALEDANFHTLCARIEEMARADGLSLKEKEE